MATDDRFSGELGFLSNFYPSPWIGYPTVEHGFQAAKVEDRHRRAVIARASSPGEAKRLGRTSVLRADWEQVKVGVMEELLRKKFADPELRRMLVTETPEELVEVNHWHDNVWGDCICRRCSEIEGRNLLGKLLMKIRAELRAA